MIKPLPALLFFGVVNIVLTGSAQENKMKSHAELSNYEETNRHDDVARFFNELQKGSPLVRVDTFGHSQEGRALPLVILSDPPISEPRDARASGKPIVLFSLTSTPARSRAKKRSNTSRDE